MDPANRPALFELVTDAVTAWRDTSAEGALEHDFGEKIRLAATYDRAAVMAEQLACDADESRRHVGYRLLAAVAELQPHHRVRIARFLAVELPRITDEPLRIAAIDALGSTRHGDAVPGLLRAASVVADNEVGARVAIVRAVTECAVGEVVPQAVAFLLKAMDDPVPAVREWATFGLGARLAIDSSSLRDAFARRLFDEDEHARLEAVRALARRRDSRAVGAIAAAMNGEKYPDEIIEAALYLAGPRLWPVIKEMEVDADPALERLRTLCDPADQALRDGQLVAFLQHLEHHPDAQHVAVVCTRFELGARIVEIATGSALDLQPLLDETRGNPEETVRRVFELL